MPHDSVHSLRHKPVMLLVADLYEVSEGSARCDDRGFSKDFAEEDHYETEVADPPVPFQVREESDLD